MGIQGIAVRDDSSCHPRLPSVIAHVVPAVVLSHFVLSSGTGSKRVYLLHMQPCDLDVQQMHDVGCALFSSSAGGACGSKRVVFV